MTHEKMVDATRFIREEYGIRALSDKSVLNVSRALLVIAGADGEVSAAEQAWLVDNMRMVEVPEDIIEECTRFDYKAANLNDLLSGIKVDVASYSAGAHLVYLAIFMCSADGKYADAERRKVLSAAKRLKVTDETVMALHALVDMEKAVVRMRKALFHIDSL